MGGEHQRGGAIDVASAKRIGSGPKRPGGLADRSGAGSLDKILVRSRRVFLHGLRSDGDAGRRAPGGDLDVHAMGRKRGPHELSAGGWADGEPRGIGWRWRGEIIDARVF